MTIDEFVAALSEMLGEPAEWEDGTLSFEAEGGATVTLEYDAEEDLLHLYADIGRVEERDLPPLAPTLLDANLYAGATGGTAAFGYDRDEEKVMLWDKFPLEGLRFETFRERFGVFVAAVLHWSANLLSEGGGPSGGGPEPAGPPPGMIMPGMMA